LKVAEGRPAHILVLQKDLVSELDHFLEALQGVLANGVQVVVVLAIDHRLDVALDMVEILHGLSVLVHPQVALSKVHLEPHGLHFVDARLIPARAEEEVHSVLCLLQHINFGHLLAAKSVKGSVGGIKGTSLLKELLTPDPVTASLAYLALDLVEFDQSGRVHDRHVDEVLGAFEILHIEIVLG